MAEDDLIARFEITRKLTTKQYSELIMKEVSRGYNLSNDEIMELFGFKKGETNANSV